MTTQGTIKRIRQDRFTISPEFKKYTGVTNESFIVKGELRIPNNAVWERLIINTSLAVPEGCIIRRSHYYEILCVDGTPVRCLQYAKSGHVYNICIQDYVNTVDKRKIRLHCFDSLIGAIACAYSRPYSNLSLHVGRVFDRKIIKYTEVNVIVKLVRPMLTVTPDIEYNSLTGNSTAPVVAAPVKVELCQEVPTATPDEELYTIFKDNMDQLLETPHVSAKPLQLGKSKQIGILETLPGEELLVLAKKCDTSFEYVHSCVRANGFPALVSRFPKLGHVTSDGNIRSIYPMNVLYECALRLYFQDKKFQHPHYLEAKGRSFGTPMRLFYDCISCDHQMTPYIGRYAVETQREWLVPRVHDSIYSSNLQDVGYAAQFPSGVYHTSLMNRVYVCSLLQRLNVRKAVTQGDGFMCDESLNDPRIRRVCDFNGFIFDGTNWIYNRGHRLLEWKCLRGKGPVGINRFYINFCAYSYLGAKGLFYPPQCSQGHRTVGVASCRRCRAVVQGRYHLHQGCPVTYMTVMSKLYQIASAAAVTVLEENGIEFDRRTNSWDCLPSLSTTNVMSSGSGKTILPRYRF